TRPSANRRALPRPVSGEPGLAHCDARTSPPARTLRPRGTRQRPRPWPAPPRARPSAGARTAQPTAPPTAAPVPPLPRGAPRRAPEPDLTQVSPPRFALPRLAWTGSGPLSLHGGRRERRETALGAPSAWRPL
ncbi:unnamed protein product, partial [Gulo gulo]